MSQSTRREFLVGTSAVAGAVALGACSGSDGAASAPTSSPSTATIPVPTSEAPDPTVAPAPTTAPFDPTDWGSVRGQFALAAGPDARFDAFVLAAHPRPVADAIERHRARLDADGERYLEQRAVEGGDQAVLTAAAEYLDADPDEIALTPSTTVGLGLLYAGLRVRSDQRVLVTDHDFYSTHQAWQLRAKREGIAVDRVALYTDPTDPTAMVSNLVAAVTPATRIVAITWVHSGTGVKLPVAEIAAALADVNAGRASADRALLCVDGVHGFGVEDVTVAELGCDFLVSGTHKWLFGPRGTGIVWGTAAAWEHVDPAVPAFEGESFGEWVNDSPIGPTTAARFTPGGTHAYEHRWSVVEAFDFHRRIGKDRIAAYTHEQATRLKEGLAEAPGVRVITPLAPELSSGIVCVEVPGVSPFEAVERLRGSGIVAGSTPYRESYLRFGPSIVTTPDQVDAVVAELGTW